MGTEDTSQCIKGWQTFPHVNVFVCPSWIRSYPNSWFSETHSLFLPLYSLYTIPLNVAFCNNIQVSMVDTFKFCRFIEAQESLYSLGVCGAVCTLEEFVNQATCNKNVLRVWLFSFHRPIFKSNISQNFSWKKFWWIDWLSELGARIHGHNWSFRMYDMECSIIYLYKKIINNLSNSVFYYFDWLMITLFFSRSTQSTVHMSREPWSSN